MDFQDLADWVLEDRLPVRYQIQLHKIIWGANVHGV
jgi:7-carboxy-7-deazaguanine synthase